jgi:2Fe-2S ferredoxin
MPTIRLMPHPLCPSGLSFEAPEGSLLVDALLVQGVAMEHACEKVCACATCHVHVRQGRQSLAGARDIEEDQLDMAWGVDADSRLACQVRVGRADLVVELPRHTRNHAREHAA